MEFVMGAMCLKHLWYQTYLYYCLELCQFKVQLCSARRMTWEPNQASRSICNSSATSPTTFDKESPTYAANSHQDNAQLLFQNGKRRSASWSQVHQSCGISSPDSYFKEWLHFERSLNAPGLTQVSRQILPKQMRSFDLFLFHADVIYNHVSRHLPFLHI